MPTNTRTLVVLDEHTLSVIASDTPHLHTPLAVSVIRGAPPYSLLAGTAHVLHGTRVRRASQADLNAFRVHYAPETLRTRYAPLVDTPTD